MYFTFNQNNSGGDFDYDEDRGITHFVIIEADNSGDAYERAENIGLYFGGVEDGRDCECCGDRWYPPYGDGDQEPLVYGKNPRTVEERKEGWMDAGREVCIHMKDGSKQWYGAVW